MFDGSVECSYYIAKFTKKMWSCGNKVCGMYTPFSEVNIDTCFSRIEVTTNMTKEQVLLFLSLSKIEYLWIKQIND